MSFGSTFRNAFTRIEGFFANALNYMLDEMEVFFGKEAPQVLNDTIKFAGQAVIEVATMPGSGQDRFNKAVELTSGYLLAEGKKVSTDFIREIVQKQYNQKMRPLQVVSNETIQKAAEAKTAELVEILAGDIPKSFASSPTKPTAVTQPSSPSVILNPGTGGSSPTQATPPTPPAWQGEGEAPIVNLNTQGLPDKI
jgi:hypothetical protein